MALPIWARILERAGWAMHEAHRAEQVVRSELLLAFLPEEQRHEFTFHSYSRLVSYLPGGETFERGLVDWEEDLVRRAGIGPGAQVLLGGAGGGRELQALAGKGFSVVAFEPTQRLYEGSCEVASRFPGSRCVRASYGDLVRAARGEGPLAPERRDFDLVYFGWGSFTHLTSPAEQLAVLSATRVIAPRAPVLLSFWMRAVVFGSKTDRFRTRVRKLLSLVRGKEPSPALEVHGNAGFGYCFEREEFELLAARAGYGVSLFLEEEFPRAILTPLPSAA